MPTSRDDRDELAEIRRLARPIAGVVYQPELDSRRNWVPTIMVGDLDETEVLGQRVVPAVVR